MSELDNNDLLALKERIAKENKLPPGMANRLKGNTIEEIRADAVTVRKILGINSAPPLATMEPPTYGNMAKVKLYNAQSELLQDIFRKE